MTTDLLQSITFGAQGNDSNYLGAGWASPESGYRWMVGSESDLWLENPGPGNGFVLEVALAPFCYPPALVAQRVEVEVRGRVVGRSVMTSRRTIGFRIPPELVAEKGPVRIIFRHPDATRPVDCGAGLDQRRLALSVRSVNLFRADGDMTQFSLAGGQGISISELEARTGMPAKEFMLHFESLGDNCEFGLVQRRCGAEPLGLLRFTNLALNSLIRGVRNGFDGLGELQNLEVSLTPGFKPEYSVRDKIFALTFHTFLYQGEADEQTLPRQQSNRLKFLRRKMLEDLANGEKIFVYKRNDPLNEDEVLPLQAALNQYCRNTLLWVVPADVKHEAGTVEQILPGLLKGYVDRFAPYENAHDLSFEVWLNVCANAWQLAQRAADTPGPASADTDQPAQSNEQAATASDPRELAPAGEAASSRELVMRFESLGGAGHGREFGLFQRSFDGVPVGLLGWTDLDHAILTDLLNARFEGIGDPANTEVVVPHSDGDAEYWARDRRHALTMRCFMRAQEGTEDNRDAQVCRRLRYLRQKLVEDLAAGNKIFIFNSMSHDLTGEELGRLHQAVRSYGAQTTLIYVCAADAEHPSGTAYLVEPGLIVGHIALCPDNEKLPVTQDWLALCKSALALWCSGAVASADGAADAGTSRTSEQIPDLENTGAATITPLDDIPDVVTRGLDPAGFMAAARGLRETQRLDAAEVVLAEGIEQYPDQPGLLAEYCLLAQDRHAWPEALQRCDRLRRDFPDETYGYIGASLALRELQRFDDADALLAMAIERFPDQSLPLVHHAVLAEHRRDWPVALHRWRHARQQFPDDPVGYLRATAILRQLERLDEAETMIATALERFPSDQRVVIDAADLAARREDWPLALARWLEARRRFPEDDRIDARLQVAQMRAHESPVDATASMPQEEADATAAQDANGDEVPLRAIEPATVPEPGTDPAKQRQFPRVRLASIQFVRAGLDSIKDTLKTWSPVAWQHI